MISEIETAEIRFMYALNKRDQFFFSFFGLEWGRFLFLCTSQKLKQARYFIENVISIGIVKIAR